MTTVDSTTMASLDATDFAFSAAKNNDNAQVGVLKVTSEELENPQDESNLNPVKYIPKGYGTRPLVRTGIKPPKSQPPPPPPANGSSPKKSSGTVKSSQSLGTSSRGKSKTKGGN